MDGWFYYGISNGAGVLFTVVFLAVCIPRFKNADYKRKCKPLRFVFILLILLEIAKIGYHIADTGSYPPQRYPIVFCSLTMYVYPILCHADKDKLPARISAALAIIPSVVIGGMYLFVTPAAHGNTWYSFIMNLHSRFYHFCMFAGAIYMLATNMYDFRFQDWFPVCNTVNAYFLFCTVMSLFLGGDISYFGPNSKPMSLVYDTFGYVVGNVLLCIVVYLVGLTVYGGVRFVKEKLLKKR